MKRWPELVAAVAIVLGLVGVASWLSGCGGTCVTSCLPRFVDSYSSGVPNLERIAPRLWRMGQPPDAIAWQALRGYVSVDGGGPVVVVKLNDDAEGDDNPAVAQGWTVRKRPLVPEDDKPWTVLEVPSRASVHDAVDSVLDAYAKGATVLIHCVHGRDRTSLVSALVGRALWGWSKERGWRDMLIHGFRWELPGLDIFWAETPEAHR